MVLSLCKKVPADKGLLALNSLQLVNNYTFCINILCLMRLSGKKYVQRKEYHFKNILIKRRDL